VYDVVVVISDGNTVFCHYVLMFGVFFCAGCCAESSLIEVKDKFGEQGDLPSFGTHGIFFHF
jgi:hypothetical protein